MIQSKIREYYDKFVGLPSNNPIIRRNIENDALTLVVLEVLYGKELDYEITPKNIEQICKSIVAPPDNGIDLFVERVDGDEYSYDVIQVKNTELGDQDINQCFAVMKRTIDNYLKNPSSLSNNLKKVISETNFDSIYKKNCTYYVVHKGDLNYCSGIGSQEKVVTYSELETLSNSLQYKCVPNEIITLDRFNNFILYGEDEQQTKQTAYLCNLNGYDLALLSNKYASTEIGRNLLFGQNLRDSLDKKSKTYGAMKKTIDKEPEKFWYYNNGITIIAKDIDINTDKDKKKGDWVELKEFSIINGAQTTSALGLYLKEARMNKEEEKVELLKKVYVLTRILIVSEEDFRSNIAIYNNMQNPITSRDMVANREEQERLHSWLMYGEKPNIFVEIRRGSNAPSSISLYPHQKKTNNETLAQLSFAAFYRQPFIAKDKKKSLFNNDYSQEEFTINKDYHKIFNYSNNIEECGILFQKTKEEINELLFIEYLHKEAKKYLKNRYMKKIDTAREAIRQDGSEECQQRNSNMIITYQTLSNINNICLFYNVALYYEMKAEFSVIDKNKIFRYEQFYSNKKYREEVVETFANKVLTKTIEILKEKSEGSSNINNWIRSAKNQDVFLKTLRDNIAIKLDYEKDFAEFVLLAKE